VHTANVSALETVYEYRMRMQMFNVQFKKRQEARLVYCTNRTKRLIGKTKKKTIQQSRVREGSPMDGVGTCGGKDLPSHVQQLWRPVLYSCRTTSVEHVTTPLKTAIILVSSSGR